MADVFVSYNQQDRPAAKRVADALVAEGFSVWWDRHIRLGETYDEITEAELRSARCVMVLWSPRSTASRWVRAEATVADRRKTLLPVTIEACERPVMFELTQTTDLSQWRGSRADPEWRVLVDEVARMLGSAERSASELPALPPAPHAPVLAGEQGEAPSLAVLPFTNRSGAPEDEVFAVGLVEDLIDALSGGGNLRVVARSATARFRQDAIFDFAAMARELGVRYVMEGNIRRSGDLLRVSAQLVEASDGSVLWTQKFEYPLSRLGDLEEELVLEVSANLETQVTRAEMARALRKPDDLTAWECCTRAVAAYRQVGIENLIQARDEAARAVEIAPDYGLAHAMLADAEATLYMWASPDDPAQVRAIRSRIDRALTFEPNNPVVLAHVAEAFNYVGLPAQALGPAAAALKLRPHNALAHYTYGIACSLLDRIPEAIFHLDAELKAAPGSHTLFASYNWRGSAHVRAGQWEEAEVAYSEGIRLNPAAGVSYFGLAAVLAHLARHTEALEAMNKARELSPGMPLEMWERGVRRWWANNPVTDSILGDVRALWI